MTCNLLWHIWTAYVNGEEVETLRTNTAYTGLILEAGDYDIELKYLTPWLREGVACSIAGIGIFVGIVVYNRRKAKK
ncbi:MAG: YfhO family protein [Coriobacteriales bacterium]|nr:YfhO family protein [Coriobacteriales bacterium]